MSYIPHPIILEGARVKLVPLEEKYFDALLDIGAAKEIWNHLPLDGCDRSTLLTELKSAVMKRLSGEQYPFVIIDKTTDKVIGSTRFLNIFPEHRKLEIGWTWYDPAYWGSGHNNECKFLLLTYCFEQLKTIRVQLQTREQNARSRAAIQKTGAKFEGVLRNDRIRMGERKDTYVFSIIEEEWEETKLLLETKIAPGNAV